MRLAINTFVYEVAGYPLEKTFKSVIDHGFTYVEYAAYGAEDPTSMSKQQKKDLVKIFKDNGLECSQMLIALINRYIASPDPKVRQKVQDNMRICAELMYELGGKQILVCEGCGVHQIDMVPEEAWMNTANQIRSLAEWGKDDGILVDLELDPHVYYVVNNTQKMVRMIEDIGMPNVFPNVDIGHLWITREGPEKLEKFKDRILHVHISETDSFEHTNSIIGTGTADFRAYLDKCYELGIEENCKCHNTPCIAGIEMGDPGGDVDDPERWIDESIEYIKKNLAELSI